MKDWTGRACARPNGGMRLDRRLQQRGVEGVEIKAGFADPVIDGEGDSLGVIEGVEAGDEQVAVLEKCGGLGLVHAAEITRWRGGAIRVERDVARV